MILVNLNVLLVITRAVRRHELSSRSHFTNSFLFYLFIYLFIHLFGGGGGGEEGRDGPRDKASGHELSSRSRSLYSGREAPS